MNELAITHVDVLGTDTIKRDATIIVNKGYITDIVDSKNTIEASETFDGKHMLAAPGLVNTHTHIAMGLLRNYADDRDLMDWLENAIWPAEAKLNNDVVYWGTRLGIAEMLRSGTTCFSDMYFFMDQTAKAVDETGIRAVLSRGLAGVSPTADQALEEQKQLFLDWNGHDNDRIKVMLGPHAPYTCPDNFLEKVIVLRDELNAEIHMHLCETKGEVDNVIKATGKTPIAHMNDLGLFDNGCLAAHCVHLTDEDMNIMKEKNVRVAHNPQSNLKLASGIAPVPKLLNKGIIVGLGTDGSASNNNADMLEEVRLAAMLHKGNTYDPKVVPAATAWAMGTVEGAKALSYKDLGKLEKGYRADIVLYDVSGMHWMPRYNDLASLVYAANSSDADTVFVAGKCLMKHRELLTIDEEQLRFEMEKAQKVFE
ncbi:MAG: amidohydrolase [Veillonellaceae bacterium]|nr:amidohydrolase [Veillonellaceae bacterium]